MKVEKARDQHEPHSLDLFLFIGCEMKKVLGNSDLAKQRQMIIL